MQSVKRIAIVPFPALGDVTICLRLAQNLTKSGCEVTLFANLITSAALNFPWLKLSALPTNPAVMMPSYDPSGRIVAVGKRSFGRFRSFEKYTTVHFKELF